VAVKFGEFVIPLPFQAARHQPVLRINGHEAAARQIGLVLHALQAKLPLPIGLPGSGFDVL
jgi:hypothetical protein